MDVYTMLKNLHPRNISQNFYDYRYYQRLYDNRNDLVDQTLNFVGYVNLPVFENLMVKIENDMKSEKEKTSNSLEIPYDLEFQLKESDNAKPDMATVLRNIDNLLAYLSRGTDIENDVPKNEMERNVVLLDHAKVDMAIVLRNIDNLMAYLSSCSVISNDVSENEMKRNVVLSDHEKVAIALRNIDNLMVHLSKGTDIENDVPENEMKRNAVLHDHAKVDKVTEIKLNTDYNIGYQLDEQKNNYKTTADKTIQTSCTLDNNEFVSLQSMEKVLKLLCLLKSNVNELDEKYRARIGLGYTYTESDHNDMKLGLQSLKNDVVQLKCTFENIRGTYSEIEEIVTQYNKYESEYRNLRSIFKRGKLLRSRVIDEKREKKEKFDLCGMIKTNLYDPCCSIYKTWFS